MASTSNMITRWEGTVCPVVPRYGMVFFFFLCWRKNTPAEEGLCRRSAYPSLVRSLSFLLIAEDLLDQGRMGGGVHWHFSPVWLAFRGGGCLFIVVARGCWLFMTMRFRNLIPPAAPLRAAQNRNVSHAIIEFVSELLGCCSRRSCGCW